MRSYINNSFSLEFSDIIDISKRYLSRTDSYNIILKVCEHYKVYNHLISNFKICFFFNLEPENNDNNENSVDESEQTSDSMKKNSNLVSFITKNISFTSI